MTARRARTPAATPRRPIRRSSSSSGAAGSGRRSARPCRSSIRAPSGCSDTCPWRTRRPRPRHRGRARRLPGWRDTPALARGRILRAAAGWLRAHRREWAGLIALELGKPLAQAEAEAETACEMIDWAAEEGRRLYGRDIPPRTSGLRLTAFSEPVGPVGAIAGWNAPAITPARKIAGALGAGCSIVLKPSEATPASGLMLARAFAEAGLPPGVLNLVFGDPPPSGAGSPRIPACGCSPSPGARRWARTSPRSAPRR